MAKKAVKKAKTATSKANKARTRKSGPRRAVCSAVAADPKKTAAPGPEGKPVSLDSILEEAERAFSDIVRRYYAWGVAYVKAIRIYGAEGRRAFQGRFPLTANALRNLELVGSGRLMPQFTLCSNRFTCGLANMDDSMRWQRKLVACASGNTVKVIVDGKLQDIPLDRFLEDDGAILATISESDLDMSPTELAAKVEKLRSDVRAHFTPRPRKPDHEVAMNNGTGNVQVRFYGAKPWTISDIESVLAEMKALEAAESAKVTAAAVNI